jgi:DNA-binding phage protein
LSSSAVTKIARKKTFKGQKTIGRIGRSTENMKYYRMCFILKKRSIEIMENYRTVGDITVEDFIEEYLRDHPDEIDEYLTELFKEYAQDENMDALLTSLRAISRIKGVSFIAETVGLSQKGVQKAPLGEGHLTFENWKNYRNR